MIYTSLVFKHVGNLENYEVLAVYFEKVRNLFDVYVLHKCPYSLTFYQLSKMTT